MLRNFFWAYQAATLGKRALGLVMFCVIALSMALPVTASSAFAAPPQSSIVIDGHTGTTLSRSRADQKRYPASLTKMMTIYMVLERLRSGELTLDSKMIVSARAANRPASKLYLKPGERISVSLALSALIVRSANDVATVVAEHIGGSEDAFARMMTRRGRELGLLDTTFKNASGLYNWGQVTTAQDMARLAYSLLNDFPEYKHIWSQTSMNYRGQSYRSTNRLLTRLPGAIGMKTGYIRASGYNIVSVAERDGKRLIAVVIGGRSSKDRDRTAISLTEKTLHRASSKRIKQQQLTPLARPNFIPATASEKARRASGVSNISTKNHVPMIAQASYTLPINTDEQPLQSAKAGCHPISQDRQTGWAVQLGAFLEQKEANAHINRVMSQMVSDKLPKEVSSSTSAVECNGHRLYRARLAGLTQKSAQAICSSLRQKNTDCFTVSP